MPPKIFGLVEYSPQSLLAFGPLKRINRLPSFAVIELEISQSIPFNMAYWTYLFPAKAFFALMLNVLPFPMLITVPPETGIPLRQLIFNTRGKTRKLQCNNIM